MFRNAGNRRKLSRKRKAGGLLAFVLAAVIGLGAYAFTASNTVTAHSAGAGVGAVSGYVVASPDNYRFNPAGTEMVGVTFELNKAATDVKVALTPGEPVFASWSDCGATKGGKFEVLCTFAAPVPDVEGTNLSVAAVSSGTVTIEEH